MTRVLSYKYPKTDPAGGFDVDNKKSNQLGN